MAITPYDSHAIAVFIPLIVGLAPGLVYWFVITAKKATK